VRSRWLDSSLAAIKALRGRGIPVLGYTWFPMFTMIDWRYRTGRRPKEAYQIDLGLFTLADDSGSRWRPLPLVEKFCSYTQRPQEIIGPLNEPGAMDL
jgi:hypothetical protein